METILRNFLEKNYKDYAKEPLKIGFTHSFPENTSQVIDKMIFEKDGHKVEVRLTKLTFGDKNEFSVTGIVTDHLTIPRKGPMGGHGEHGYADEAEIMKLAAIDMAYKHKFMICQNVCAWPFVKLVVGKPIDAHLKNFILSKNN